MKRRYEHAFFPEYVEYLIKGLNENKLKYKIETLFEVDQAYHSGRELSVYINSVINFVEYRYYQLNKDLLSYVIKKLMNHPQMTIDILNKLSALTPKIFQIIADNMKDSVEPYRTLEFNPRFFKKQKLEKFYVTDLSEELSNLKLSYTR